MLIGKDRVVTLRYRLADGAGRTLEAGEQAYLHGGYGNTFAKVEAALEGQAAGYATSLGKV